MTLIENLFSKRSPSAKSSPAKTWRAR